MIASGRETYGLRMPRRFSCCVDVVIVVYRYYTVITNSSLGNTKATV